MLRPLTFEQSLGRNGSDVMAQQEKKDREDEPRRRAADADAADTDESTTETDAKRKARQRLRRWQKPLIGLGIAGVAAPVAGKAKAAETFRTVRTSKAERGETAAKRGEDIEETLAERVGEALTGAVRGDPISEFVSRYARYGISRRLAQDIYDVARQEGITPRVAFGLVRTESSFREHVVSHAGAVGLAQVLPSTANWLVPGTSRQDLFDRRTNLRVGFRYLNYLLRKYDGDMKLALTAYNRGPGTVDRVLARGGDPDNGYAGKVLGG